MMVIPAGNYAYSAWKQKSYDYQIYRAFHQQRDEFAFLTDRKIASSRSTQVLCTQLAYLFHCHLYGIWSEQDHLKAKSLNVEYILSGESIQYPGLNSEGIITVSGYPVYIYRVQ
ncbi:MAG TPA: hypothetical protein VM012_14315 [Flavitalea sp.]|nr:hypothetical protein [Flavitalea sp.]